MKNKLNTEEFIRRAIKVHGNKYDYTLSYFTFSKNKIRIVCKKHGEFEQRASSHLHGNGCIKCGAEQSINNRKMTHFTFINKAKKLYKDLYSYSLLNYKDYYTKVKIICNKHGIFEQSPEIHLIGNGCPKCGREKGYNSNTSSIRKFIRISKKVHGNMYDYSLSIYEGCNKKIKIICLKHGVFEQTPSSHLSGKGCPRCGIEKVCNKKRLSIDNFINKSNLVHNNKYDYSVSIYYNNSTKIKVRCPLHGVYEVIPSSHLAGHGCAKCAFENLSKISSDTKEDFLEKALKIHGCRYDYSLVDYKNGNTKVKIKCSKHGLFEQTPKKHIQDQGCPSCNSSRGEKIIDRFLKNTKIFFERRKVFDRCRNINVLPFDFYIPLLNTCIEYDGIQHFLPIPIYGGEKALESQRLRDSIKSNFCQINHINLIRISYKMSKQEILCTLKKELKDTISL